MEATCIRGPHMWRRMPTSNEWHLIGFVNRRFELNLHLISTSLRRIFIAICSIQKLMCTMKRGSADRSRNWGQAEFSELRDLCPTGEFWSLSMKDHKNREGDCCNQNLKYGIPSRTPSTCSIAVAVHLVVERVHSYQRRCSKKLQKSDTPIRQRRGFWRLRYAATRATIRIRPECC